MKLLLASGSPRRRELLTRMGYDFDIMPCDVDESFDENMHPKEVAEYLSYKKAKAAADTTKGYVVIGSDTIVVINDMILGKPADRDDAYKMIKLLSDNNHEVITGVTIIKGETSITQTISTKVHFVKMTDDEINSYIDTAEPYDKAGGYGIQGKAGIYIDRVEGDYYNIMGFPMATVRQMIKEIINT